MSEIIHKTEPVEHWIVDGKAYRLATEGDIDKFVYRSDRSIERALEAKQERLASVWVGNELRFECHGFKWRFAYIQDDSLLTPPVFTPTTKPINWTKPVRTKDGRAVRVLCTDGPDAAYPVIGIIAGNKACTRWAINGKWWDGRDSNLDLENAPQRIQREYWVNVYPDNIGAACATKQASDEMRANRCIACVKITIDCEEGEGL